MSFPSTKIIGTGSYVPEEVLYSQQLEERLGLKRGYIESLTGISERRIVNSKINTSDLATMAAKRAIRSAGISPSYIGLIIVSTTSPDMFFPSTACLVQKNLGINKAVAFDISASCTGFIYGLSIATQFIKNNPDLYALLISAEVKSRFIDWKDPKTCILFGDGAGAVVLKGTTDKAGIIDARLYSDGSLSYILEVPGGGSREPITYTTIRKGHHYLKMKGEHLFRVAVKRLESSIIDFLGSMKIEIPMIDHFLFHQANIRIIYSIARRLNIPEKDLIITLDLYGNTSSSSIPIALDLAVRKKKIKKGDTILLAAFGGGLTWGTALIQW